MQYNCIIYFILILLCQMILRTKSSEAELRAIKKLVRPKRIIQGRTATPEMTFYHATIKSGQFDSQQSSTCGGNLISQNYVLTAAHCVYKSDMVLVIFNGPFEASNDFETNDGMTAPKTLNIYCDPHDIRVHESFSSSGLLYDIALVRLRQTIQFSSILRPISLPQRTHFGRTYDFITGQLCGVGMIVSPVYGLEPGSDIVMCTNVTVSSTACQLYEIPLPPEILCVRGWTGNSGQGSLGDSGGGLIVDGVLVAILLGSVTEYHPFGPSLYSKVAPYMEWILQNSDL